MLASIGMILGISLVLYLIVWFIMWDIQTTVEAKRKEDMMDKVRMAALSDELARDREVRSWKYVNR